jgi:hypothetical protein
MFVAKAVNDSVHLVKPVGGDIEILGVAGIVTTEDRISDVIRDLN